MFQALSLSSATLSSLLQAPLSNSMETDHPPMGQVFKGFMDAHFTIFSPFEVYSDEKSQEIFEKKARVSHLSKYFLSEIGKN